MAIPPCRLAHRPAGELSALAPAPGFPRPVKAFVLLSPAARHSIVLHTPLPLCRPPPQVERIFRQSAEFASEHDTWKLNVAHTFFMQEAKYREAIRCVGGHGACGGGVASAVQKLCVLAAVEDGDAAMSHPFTAGAAALVYQSFLQCADPSPWHRSHSTASACPPSICPPPYCLQVLRAHRQEELGQPAGCNRHRAREPVRQLHHDEPERGGGGDHATVRACDEQRQQWNGATDGCSLSFAIENKESWRMRSCWPICVV